MTTLRPGIYKHYKGNLYQVIEVATHSETREKVVVYRPMYGEQALWVRPLAMFTEEVDVGGIMVPRFAWQSAGPAPQTTTTPAAKASAVTRTAAPVPVEVPVSNVADSSVEERVKAAMSRGDDKPDFSSVPVFEDTGTLIKVSIAVVAVIVVLIFLF